MSGGDYGRIRHTFWTDPDIKRVLNPEQKTLLLYYFSSPHRTLIGLYYCPLEYAASETGIPLDRVREWTTGALARFVTYDAATEEILVHRAGKHQVGEHLAEKDHQRKAVVKALQEAHSAKLVRRFLELYPHWSLNVSPPEGGEPVSEAPSEPLESPSEAKAVAEQYQSSSTTETDSPSGEGAVVVVDAELVEDEESTGTAVIPFERDPVATVDALHALPPQFTTRQLLGMWIKRQGVEPDEKERKRQGAVAKRLAEAHSALDIALALLGMEVLFPYAAPPRGRGQAWDLFTFEMKFSIAKQEARKHPALQEAQMDAAIDEALNRRGAA